MTKSANNLVSSVKTNEEIKLMEASGNICAQTLKTVIANISVGVSCKKLDDIARFEIEQRGAQSSFMTVEDYKWTICTTINEEVVHGIPTDRALKDGDILGVDIGAVYKGYHSDMAASIGVGNLNDEAKKFLQVGQKTLKEAITKARIGNFIGDISATIQEGIESNGYSVVKNLTGHGIGKNLHEDPIIPCFGKKGTGPKILKNMVLAIEVIYTQGSGEVKLEQDGWTIRSKDGSLGGLFEQTVAVCQNGPRVLTPYL